MGQIRRDGEEILGRLGAEFPSTTTSAKTFILEIPTETIGDTDLSYIKPFVVMRVGVHVVYINKEL